MISRWMLNFPPKKMWVSWASDARHLTPCRTNGTRPREGWESKDLSNSHHWKKGKCLPSNPQPSTSQHQDYYMFNKQSQHPGAQGIDPKTQRLILTLAKHQLTSGSLVFPRQYQFPDLKNTEIIRCFLGIPLQCVYYHKYIYIHTLSYNIIYIYISYTSKIQFASSFLHWDEFWTPQPLDTEK